MKSAVICTLLIPRDRTAIPLSVMQFHAAPSQPRDSNRSVREGGIPQTSALKHRPVPINNQKSLCVPRRPLRFKIFALGNDARPTAMKITRNPFIPIDHTAIPLPIIAFHPFPPNPMIPIDRVGEGYTPNCGCQHPAQDQSTIANQQSEISASSVVQGFPQRPTTDDQRQVPQK